MADGSNKTSLKQLFQGMAGKGAEVLQGIVQPGGKIQIANDEKLIIDSNNTYIPRQFTNYTAECSIETNDGKSSVDGNITIQNALQAGEKVYVLSFNNGKQYYVLDRVN